jgi:hypothetical protein
MTPVVPLPLCHDFVEIALAGLPFANPGVNI